MSCRTLCTVRTKQRGRLWTDEDKRRLSSSRTGEGDHVPNNVDAHDFQHQPPRLPWLYVSGKPADLLTCFHPPQAPPAEESLYNDSSRRKLPQSAGLIPKVRRGIRGRRAALPENNRRSILNGGESASRPLM